MEEVNAPSSPHRSNDCWTSGTKVWTFCTDVLKAEMAIGETSVPPLNHLFANSNVSLEVWDFCSEISTPSSFIVCIYTWAALGHVITISSPSNRYEFLHGVPTVSKQYLTTM